MSGSHKAEQPDFAYHSLEKIKLPLNDKNNVPFTMLSTETCLLVGVDHNNKSFDAIYPYHISFFKCLTYQPNFYGSRAFILCSGSEGVVNQLSKCIC